MRMGVAVWEDMFSISDCQEIRPVLWRNPSVCKRGHAIARIEQFSTGLRLTMVCEGRVKG